MLSLYKSTGVVAHHLTATMAVCLLIGRKLGLPNRALSDLCMTAVLHDVALVDLPKAQQAKENIGLWRDAHRARARQDGLRALHGRHQPREPQPRRECARAPDPREVDLAAVGPGEMSRHPRRRVRVRHADLSRAARGSTCRRTARCGRSCPAPDALRADRVQGARDDARALPGRARRCGSTAARKRW